MRLPRRSLVKSKTPRRLLLPAAASLSLATAKPPTPEPARPPASASAHASTPQSTVLWHAGNFRYLESTSGDMLTFMQGLTHPNAGGYGKLSTTRKANFSAFLDAMFTAIDDSLDDGLTGSVSVLFANNLDVYVPGPSAVDSCQEYAGNPPSALCGGTNIEGRYTNNHDAGSCPSAASVGSGRFLHVEQAPTLRDNDDGDGWYWGDIRDALAATWPACNMNNGATDCTLGPQQTQYSTWSCSGTTALGYKVAFYGYPDNDDGSGNYGTNVIAHALQWQGHGRHTDSQGNPVAGGVGTFEDPVAAANQCNPVTW